MLGRSGSERAEPTADLDVEFETKNVHHSADYQLGFYGAYSYVDDEGRDHRVEREFAVYTDPERRVDGLPLARVREDHSVVGGAGSDRVDARELEVPVEVDPTHEGIALRSGVRAFLERWNREHAERR